MVEENWTSSEPAITSARELAEKSIHANEALSDGYIALGRALALRKDFTGALEQFNIALKRSSNNGDTYLQKGKTYVRLGKYKEALEALVRASELSPRDPEVLQTLGFASQLNGNTTEGISYHQTALTVVNDSLEYLLGPVADALLLDPNLSPVQSERVISACEHRIAELPEDFATVYRLSRMLQVSGKRTEGTTLLENLEKTLRAELKSSPANSSAMIYLALTLTRLGRFPEATTWGQKAVEVNGSDPTIKYRLAQMYSLQMYSTQRKKLDEKKKDEATRALKNALSVSYRLNELANADFYNMYKYSDFQNVITTAGQ